MQQASAPTGRCLLNLPVGQCTGSVLRAAQWNQGLQHCHGTLKRAGHFTSDRVSKQAQGESLKYLPAHAVLCRATKARQALRSRATYGIRPSGTVTAVGP